MNPKETAVGSETRGGMMELTREQIEESRACGVFQCHPIRFELICDLALTHADARQEGYREGLREAARICKTMPQYGKYPEDAAPVILAVVAALTQARGGKCSWDEDGEGSFYATSCGHAFTLNDGTPEQNGMKFCCYCGKEIAAPTPAELKGADRE